jgi:hypothetical protein
MTEVTHPIEETRKPPQEPLGDKSSVPASPSEGIIHQLAKAQEAQDKQRLMEVRAQAGILNNDRQEEKTEEPLQRGTKLSLAELRTTYLAPGGSTREYTNEERFYINNGWKEYLKRYGDNASYNLEEIMRDERHADREKLDAGEILEAIQEGAVTNPNALPLYGKLKIEQTRAYFTKWAEDHAADRPDAKDVAAQAIAMAEEECNPLIKGEAKELTRFSLGQVRSKLGIYKNENLTLDDTQRELYYAQAQSWLGMAERASAMQENTTTTTVESAQPQLTAEQQGTIDLLRENPALLDALSALRKTSSENVQAASDIIQQNQPELIQQAGSGLLDLLLELMKAIQSIPKEAINNTAKAA